MTASLPPPANPRLAFFLERTSAIARFIAALLVTLVSVRFAVAGFQHALGVSESNFAEAPVSHSVQLLPAGSGGPSGFRAPSASSSAPALAPPPRGEGGAGRPVRATLEVSAGPPRSEVYVNGHVVGQTPFLGDTSCKVGQPLRIEIVPPKGAPLSYSRTCWAGMIEVSGPPP